MGVTKMPGSGLAPRSLTVTRMGQDGEPSNAPPLTCTQMSICSSSVSGSGAADTRTSWWPILIRRRKVNSDGYTCRFVFSVPVMHDGHGLGKLANGQRH